MQHCAQLYGNITADQIALAEGGLTLSGGNIDHLTAEQMQMFSPLNRSTDPKLSGGNATTGTIVSKALEIIYPLVGILLFALLIWGGIEMMMAGVTGNSGKAEQGKKRIIAAILGAVLVFGSYIVLKLIQALLGIDIGI